MKEVEAKKKIIEYFRKNEGLFVSGEDVSRALGFSRAGAWKYISKLRDDGYLVEAIPHLGYRLKSSPDKLYGHEIAVGLKTKVIGKGNIHHFETIASTNDKAYELAEAGEAEGAFVAAEIQTQGKGRMGRKWSSPAGGVYVSLILRPNVETDEIPTITLVAALAVVRAIKSACGLKAQIKWPNDVFIGGNKVCGILTEIKAQPDRVDFLVLGMGINVNTASGKMPPGATSLKTECGKNLSRSGFLREVLEEFEKDYNIFKKEGFLALRDECRSFSVLIGRKVTVTDHSKKYEGIAEDIDEKGRLVLNVGGRKTYKVFSGDVTLCR